MKHKHLSLEERHYISIELKNKSSINAIAKALHRPQGTISKEIQRNTGKRGYRYQQAHSWALKRLSGKQVPTKMTADIIAEIDAMLMGCQWSPEQIAGRLKYEKNISLHHETIYRYIIADKENGGFLYKNLRHSNKTYRKRSSSQGRYIGIPNRVDIDERPDIINNRQRVGDWEGDLIIGANHKGAIVTLDERKSKLRLAFPINAKLSALTTEAIIHLLSPFKALVKSITFDNGREFAKHTEVAEALRCNTYFAKPYHSWERGQNENANGLLRQYFPKGMELIDIAVDEVLKAVDKLNSRPRKCLGFKTPYEVFNELTGLDGRILAMGIL
ncbi:MAG: IS30 family transposase [Sulfuricurvum sp.]